MTTKRRGPPAWVLEVQVGWQDSVFETIAVRPGQPITLGESMRARGLAGGVVPCDVAVPSFGLEHDPYPLAVPNADDPSSYTIHLHNSFRGLLRRTSGEVCTLDALRLGGATRPSDNPWAVAYPLERNETLLLQHHTIFVQLRMTRRTPAAVRPLSERLNYTWINIFILSLFAHTVGIVSFSAWHPSAALADAPPARRVHFEPYRYRPAKPRPAVRPGSGGEAPARAAAPGKKGKAGRENEKDTRRRSAARALSRDPTVASASMKSALERVFAGTDRSGSSIFGATGLNQELLDALGSVRGRVAGDSGGLGGLSTRGDGPGGGGPRDSLSLGALKTKGRAGGGPGDYGPKIRLAPKTYDDLDISPLEPKVRGSLDKSIVRRVIWEHRDQIRYCYERQLTKHPGLFGKLTLEWTIKSDGHTHNVRAVESTFYERSVSDCVRSRIRNWRFPAPNGGGTVEVRYPFLFKTSG